MPTLVPITRWRSHSTARQPRSSPERDRLSYKQHRRQQIVMAWMPPQMQAIRMPVDITRFRRVILHDGFLGIPKEIFDERHFLPVWRPAPVRNTDMLPIAADVVGLAVSGNEQELGGTRPGDFESAERIAGLAGVIAVADPAGFELVTKFLFHQPCPPYSLAMSSMMAMR